MHRDHSSNYYQSVFRPATGNGVNHSTSELKQWFVMIRDSRGLFEENSPWGDGWGWALFKPDKQAVNAASNYQADCLGCHQPAKSNNWHYTEAYPVLDSDNKK
jgi:hypothetical protein